jgi:hypothetical protein
MMQLPVITLITHNFENRNNKIRPSKLNLTVDYHPGSPKIWGRYPLDTHPYSPSI